MLIGGACAATLEAAKNLPSQPQEELSTRHTIALDLTICVFVLNATPALASDPTGTLSGLYSLTLVIPWVLINLVLTAVIAIRGGYRSAASAKRHAAIGVTPPLVGIGVATFDYCVIRQPSTPWPGIETILISAGLCTLALAACFLAPLLVRRNLKKASARD